MPAPHRGQSDACMNACMPELRAHMYGMRGWRSGETRTGLGGVAIVSGARAKRGETSGDSMERDTIWRQKRRGKRRAPAFEIQMPAVAELRWDGYRAEALVMNAVTSRRY